MRRLVSHGGWKGKVIHHSLFPPKSGLILVCTEAMFTHLSLIVNAITRKYFNF
jgi:hypothetical protein